MVSEMYRVKTMIFDVQKRVQKANETVVACCNETSQRLGSDCRFEAKYLVVGDSNIIFSLS